MLSWCGELSMSDPYIHVRIRALPIQRTQLIRMEVQEAVARVGQRLAHLAHCTLPCRDGKVKVVERESHERGNSELSSYSLMYDT